MLTGSVPFGLNSTGLLSGLDDLDLYLSWFLAFDLQIFPMVEIVLVN